MRPHKRLFSWRRRFCRNSGSPAAIAIGETVFLAGAIRYHVLQGQRALPVASCASSRRNSSVSCESARTGFSTMQQNRVELSIVASRICGASAAFAEAAAPEDVIQFLRQYYEMVGQAVTGSGGSILGFARRWYHLADWRADSDRRSREALRSRSRWRSVIASTRCCIIRDSLGLKLRAWNRHSEQVS